MIRLSAAPGQSGQKRGPQEHPVVSKGRVCQEERGKGIGREDPCKERFRPTGVPGRPAEAKGTVSSGKPVATHGHCSSNVGRREQGERWGKEHRRPPRPSMSSDLKKGGERCLERFDKNRQGET